MEILIADDDATSRLLLKARLEQLGHTPIVAEGGQGAWVTYRERRPPVVITDWLMNDMDGLELCRRIRGEGRRVYTYVILLTVKSGKGPYLEGMSAGVDDFITKPFDPDTLAARLRVAERIIGLQTEVRQLRRLLPMCSYCKKIRDEANAWHGLEAYLSSRDTAVSHGICPECLTNVVEPQIARLREES